MSNKLSVLINGARRIRDFLLAGRNPERLDYMSKEFAVENVDEMLVTMQRGTARSLWNTASPPVEQATHEIACPFGDW
jgi:hypothetical protein